MQKISIKQLQRSASNVAAISLFTNRAYPEDIARQLAHTKYSSRYWATRKQIKNTGVMVTTENIKKGHKVKINNQEVTLYNIEQTSNPTTLKILAGKTTPINAISRKPINYQAAKSLLSKSTPSRYGNEWITKKQVLAYKLKLLPNAKPVNCNQSFIDMTKEGKVTKEVEVVFYNSADLKNPEKVQEITSIIPISTKSGRKYSREIAPILIQYALEKGYTSPYWLTQETAKSIGVSIEKPQNHVTIQYKKDSFKLYNACETSSEEAVERRTFTAAFAPKSAVSGKNYPKEISTKLMTAIMTNKFKSNYFLTRSQATKLDVKILPGQNPAIVSYKNNKQRFYNLDQINEKKILERKIDSL